LHFIDMQFITKFYMQTSKPTKNYYNHTYNSIIVGLNVPKKGIEK